MNNTIVPPGISGRDINFNAADADQETIANELQLLTLGDFEPLKFGISCHRFMGEIEKFENDWVDYLPRTDRVNNRQGLILTNLPGCDHRTNPSLAQATVAANRVVDERDFCEPTEVYKHCTSLHDLLNYFQPVGRTFLVKSNTGGYFLPHRDHPIMPRPTFRIVVFLNKCGPLDYDWLIDTDRKLAIEPGRAYYVNTKKTHRTISWVDDSIHLIMNIPFTSENVSKLVASLKHAH